MKTKVAIEAASRLQLILKDERKTSVKALAAACSKDERTIYNWSHRQLPLKEINLVAKALQIDPRFFTDAAERIAERGLAPYLLIGSEVLRAGQIVGLTGMTTGAVTRFVTDNAEAMKGAHVTLHCYGQAAQSFSAALLTTTNNNYIRSLVLYDKTTIGGANACLEDLRLDRVEFHFTSKAQRLACSDASGFPVLMDSQLALGGPSALDVLDRCHGHDDAVLHYCARLPGARSFARVMDILKSAEEELLAKALDAVKAFGPHLRANVTDAASLREWIVRFVKTSAASPDQAGNVSLALEALSVFTLPSPGERSVAEKLLDEVVHGIRAFDRLTQENRLAARVARRFMAFAHDPGKFDPAVLK